MRRETHLSPSPEASFDDKLDSWFLKKRNSSFLNKKKRMNRALALPVDMRKRALVCSFTGLMMIFLVLPATNLSNVLISDVAVEASDSHTHVEPEVQSITISADVAPVNVERDDYNVSVRPSLSFAGMKTAATFINDESAKIQYPFGFGSPIADGFGPRTPICIAPGNCSGSFHRGTDFTPGDGTPIQAIADGVVSGVKDSGGSGLGYNVTIEHVIGGEKVTSVYGHMQRGSSPLVAGQVVQLGDLVGKVGSTGISTGAHLHFEIHVNGVAVDPMTWNKWNTK